MHLRRSYSVAISLGAWTQTPMDASSNFANLPAAAGSEQGIRLRASVRTIAGAGVFGLLSLAGAANLVWTHLMFRLPTAQQCAIAATHLCIERSMAVASATQKGQSIVDLIFYGILSIILTLFGLFLIFIAVWSIGGDRYIIDEEGIYVNRLLDYRLFYWKNIARFETETVHTRSSTREFIRVYTRSTLSERQQWDQSDRDALALPEYVTIYPKSCGLSAKEFLAIVERFRPKIEEEEPVA